MQILIEVMAAIVVWAAALAFSQFGIEVDLARPSAGQERPIIERSPRAEVQPSTEASDEDCPQAKAAAIHRI